MAEPYDPSSPRERFKEIEQRLGLIVRELQEAARELPAYFDEPECCPEPRIRVIDDGLAQSCGTTIDLVDGTIHAWTNGWSDMTETGNVQYLECQDCWTKWRLPEELEWN